MTHARNKTAVPDEKTQPHARRTTDAASGALNDAAGDDFFSYLGRKAQKPMSGVIGMVDLLGRTAMTLEQQTYLEMIRHNAEDLMTMLTDIIDISRIQSGTLTLESIGFDLRMMLKDISQRVLARANEKSLDYQCVISPKLSSRFRGDPGRIRQILNGLLDNAVQYTASGGITLRVTPRSIAGDQTIVAFEVADTGIGIPAARQAQLFASLQPGGAERAWTSGRPGLGLSVARQLCEMMGGDMTLESRRGGGCTVGFTIRLEKPAEEGELGDSAGGDLSNLRILLVDDSHTRRRILEKPLLSLGCRCQSAPDGQRAIEALRAASASGAPFHFAIFDMALTDMSGEALGEKIKQDPSIRETRLMMIAIIGKRGDARRCQNAGFSAYLVKPFEPAQLTESLRILMGQEPGPSDGKHQEIITRHTLLERRKKQLRILFIEPDAAMQAAAGGLLNNLGYRTDPVQHMDDALSRMANHPYDLIILEMMLPALDGFEMLRRIRCAAGGATPADVPILCLVAADAPDLSDRSMQAGGDAVLAKPFRADELEEVIDVLLKPHPVSDPQDPDGVFDETWLRDQLGDNEEMIRALVRGFMEKTPAHLQKLKEHARSRDAGQIQALGNVLKGTSSAIGAHALYRIAFQIEIAGRTAAYAMLPGLIGNLEMAFEKLKTALSASPFNIPPASEPAPVDMKIVKEIFNDNQTILHRFFSDFMTNSLETLQDIQNAVKQRDSEQIRLSAHKLKGSLRYLAAEEAVSRALKLEEIGRSGDLETADRAFQELAHAYKAVRGFISEMQAKDG